jgi:endonuclease YncB( thermonuclease family)
MKKIITTFVCALALHGSGWVAHEIVFPEREVQVRVSEATVPKPIETVTRVKDGDTFEIAADWSPYDLVWSVRVRGIDTPEKGHLARCAVERQRAAKAVAFTKKLLSESENQVWLREVQHDKYGGRIVSTVILADGTNLADHLLAAQLAKPYNGSGPKPNWCF